MSDLDSKLVILEDQDFQCELNIQTKKKLICFMNKHKYCQAQFQLASSVPVLLQTVISLMITVRPHPGKHI